jgi:hypothetical protein
MKQQTIYEVAIISIGGLNTLRQKETVKSYFSNLSKCLDQLQTALLVNGWESKINYTAVYRSLQAKKKFVSEFSVGGNKIFRVEIVPKIINPALSMLGVEEKPK